MLVTVSHTFVCLFVFIDFVDQDICSLLVYCERVYVRVVCFGGR